MREILRDKSLGVENVNLSRGRHSHRVRYDRFERVSRELRGGPRVCESGWYGILSPRVKARLLDLSLGLGQYNEMNNLINCGIIMILRAVFRPSGVQFKFILQEILF